MRHDRDLEFLQYCSNEELKALCDILTHDENGEVRYSEQLTNSDAYLEYYPDTMQGMWREIAGELQKYGGNTLMNLYRHGEGVLYADIVDDVCRKLKVEDFDPSWDIHEKEMELFRIVLKGQGDMTDEEFQNFLREMNIPGKKLTSQAVVMGMQIVMRQGGKYLAPYMTNVANYVSRMVLGRAVTVVSSGILGRMLAVATGPLGWAATAVWTAADIAAPAYRVTIPAVIMIALMRVNYLNRYETEEE